MKRDKAFQYKDVGQPVPPVKDRPKCKWCGKPLKPNYHYEWPTKMNGLAQPTREFSGSFGYSSHFCQARHGAWWAELTIEQIKTGQIKVTKGDQHG